MMKKKIAIIGAGASGLVAVKICKEEGLEPICFERSDDIGGLWKYSSDIKNCQPSVMRSTVINTSKEMMTFSDFPIPAKFPIFMHNAKVQEYFNLYADKFELRQNIKLDHEVIKAYKANDFISSGKWVLKVCDHKTNEEYEEVFDGLMLCTGHHAMMHVPEFQGIQNFKGIVKHTHDYKTGAEFENKRVVVVGIGNSGGDVAVELSKISNQVFLSTRRGSWISHRIFDNGMPLDMTVTNRVNNLLLGVLPEFIGNSFAEAACNKRFNHSLYGLKPSHRFLEQHPTVNDELPNRISTGTCIIKANIKCIGSNWIEFDDGSKEEDIDGLILATGYVFGFPYLETGVLDVIENKVPLYKYVFPPDLEMQTLCVIGCIQPLGAINPIAELQCRWFTHLMKGDVNLPSKEQMHADINAKRSEMDRRYVKSQRHTIQVDYIPYMDELACQIGCKPNLWKILFSDPLLFISVVFGPCTPYQFRLEGPSTWPGARQAILSQWDRVYESLNTRPQIRSVHQSNKYLFNIAFLIFFLLLIWTFIF